MKRTAISLLIIVSFLAFQSGQAAAGQKEWAVAGKILTGVIGGLLLHHIIHKEVAEAAPVYRYEKDPPVVYEEKVEYYVPGHYEERWVPPVYVRKCDEFGNVYYVKVREGYYARVWVPEKRIEKRYIKEWDD
ncbi:MAG: hypothetical protein QW561_04760 [Candidatus Aenigmatarchaeota archaeon]